MDGHVKDMLCSLARPSVGEYGSGKTARSVKEYKKQCASRVRVGQNAIDIHRELEERNFR
jgi:hypothetical protein